MTIFDNTVKVEFALRQFIESNEAQIKRMTVEVLTKAIKMAIMEKYANIQKIVDEIIFSPELRIEIEKIIRERIHEKVDEHIREMFGNE